MLADPQKDKATSSGDPTAPGNGDAWNTMHTNDGTGAQGAPVPSNGNGASDSSESAESDKASAAENGKENPMNGPDNKENEEIKDEATNEEAEEVAEVVPEEGTLDPKLEEEAKAAVDNVLDEVQEAQREVAEWKDKYVRLHAEWDTYRRRQKEQQEVQKALAAEKLVSSLIPVIDDLERSIAYAKEHGETGLLSGVEAVLAKFVDTLKKDGVEVIEPKGQAFNALEAQAVGTVEDSEQFDETVADVYQNGYKIGNKVLRPAMVTVTTGGPKRPEENKDEQ